MELSDRQRKLLFAALVVVLSVIGVYLTVAAPDESGDEGSSGRTAPTSAAVPTGPAVPSVPPAGIGTGLNPESFDIYRLLPFPKRDFAAAADLAQRFTAAYGTYRFDEKVEAYLARVMPMAGTELGAELQRGVSAPGLQEERAQKQTVAESTATLDSVRDIEANSIIFLVTGHQQLRENGKAVQKSQQFAVTVARDGAALRVYNIELANAGQAGDTG